MKPPHPRLRRIARATFLLLLMVAVVLLVRAARSVDWSGVGTALTGYRASTLVAAAALTVLSYLIYCGYDLAARSYVHHRLSTRRVVLIAFISYAFSLNIGALVGGTGFRFRLYAHSGLDVEAIGRVIVYSISTNWIGYLALAGGLFAIRGVAVPTEWDIGTAGVTTLGWVMLGAAVAYLIACRLSHGWVLHLRGIRFRLPTLPLAFLQLALAAANWSIMAAILHILLRGQVGYPAVLGTLLISAVASALAHIPAGIGVLEAVFLALLGHAIAPSQLLAALLAYRALYYLLPLLAAIPLYLAFEAGGRPPRTVPPSQPG